MTSHARPAFRPLALLLLAAVAPTIALAQTPIHTVQGSGGVSPLVAQTVIVRGIVTAKRTNAFFIQAPNAEADADPATSEGILVFTNSAPPAAAAVGNLVQVVGTVTEFVPSADPFSPPLTEITGPTVSLLSTGNALPTPVPLTTTLPSAAGAHDQLERFEGMRVSIARLSVVAPTQGSITETSATAVTTGVFFGVLEGLARTFREPGIASPDPAPVGYGSIPPIPRWDQDPELIRVDSDAQPGVSALSVSSGAVVTGLTGPLDFVNRRFTVLPDAGAIVESDFRQPSAVSQPQAYEYTVANLNAQRLFDTTAGGNSGPTLSASAFNLRLGKLSALVRDVMRAPDIIAVQEVENLGVLQSLATRISTDAVAAGQANPLYQAYLTEGNDATGADNGFLVKTSHVSGSPRVNVTSVTQLFASTTITSPLGVQTVLYDRPPLQLKGTVTLANGETRLLTVIGCHLRSTDPLSSETADFDWGTVGHKTRVRRHQQALTLANHIQSLQVPASDPTRGIIVTGEMSAFEFNDGYGDPVAVLRGVPTPDNQTATTGDGVDVVTPDLVNLTESIAATERYQVLLNGIAQATQHMLLSQSLVQQTSARRIEYARAGADFPETARNTAGSPVRAIETDPVVGYFASPSQLAVQGSAGARFALAPIRPNPVTGPLHVKFALAAGEPATLELYDTAGRRVESHSFAAPVAGERTMMLAPARALRPGVYHLRLAQGGRSRTQRVVVIE